MKKCALKDSTGVPFWDISHNLSISCNADKILFLSKEVLGQSHSHICCSVIPETSLILSRSDNTLSADGRALAFNSLSRASLSIDFTRRLPPITFICSTFCPVIVEMNSASDWVPSSPPIVADVQANLI